MEKATLRLTVRALLGWVMFWLVPAHVYAAFSKLEPEIYFEQLYDDNISLAEDVSDRRHAWQSTMNLGISREYRTETTAINNEFKWQHVITDTSENTESQNDLLANLSGTFRSARSTWRLDANAVQDTTTKDVLEFGADHSDEDASVTEVDVDRLRFSFRPSWRYRLTESNLLGVRHRYSEIQYGKTEGTDLIDSFRHKTEISWIIETSPRNDLVPSIEHQYFESKNGSESDIKVASISDEFQYNEFLSTDIQLSAYSLDATVDDEDKEADGFLFKFSADYRFDSKQFMLVTERVLSPGSDGDVEERDQARLSYSDFIRKDWDYNLAAHYYRERTILDSDDESNKRYLSIRASLGWTVSNDLRFSLGYRFRQKKESSDSPTTDANAAFLTVNYITEL